MNDRLCNCHRDFAIWRVAYNGIDGTKGVAYHVCTFCLNERNGEAAHNPALLPDTVERLEE